MFRLKHRFLHQRYLATPTTDRRIFYIRNLQPNPDRGIPCACLQLINFSEHTLLPYQSPVPSASRQHTSTDRRSSISKVHNPTQPNPDWWISYIPSQPLSPCACQQLIQFSEHTLLSPNSKDPSQQYHQFPACTLQRTYPPASSFAWSPAESGILLRTIRAYWSKRRVVTSSSFQN